MERGQGASEVLLGASLEAGRQAAIRLAGGLALGVKAGLAFGADKISIHISLAFIEGWVSWSEDSSIPAGRLSR